MKKAIVVIPAVLISLVLAHIKFGEWEFFEALKLASPFALLLWAYFFVQFLVLGVLSVSVALVFGAATKKKPRWLGPGVGVYVVWVAVCFLVPVEKFSDTTVFWDSKNAYDEKASEAWQQQQEKELAEWRGLVGPSLRLSLQSINSSHYNAVEMTKQRPSYGYGSQAREKETGRGTLYLKGRLSNDSTELVGGVEFWIDVFEEGSDKPGLSRRVLLVCQLNPGEFYELDDTFPATAYFARKFKELGKGGHFNLRDVAPLKPAGFYSNYNEEAEFDVVHVNALRRWNKLHKDEVTFELESVRLHEDEVNRYSSRGNENRFGVGIVADIDNTTADPLDGVVFDLQIKNGANDMLVAKERIYLKKTVFPHVTCRVDDENKFRTGELHEVANQIGEDRRYIYDLVAVVPQGLSDTVHQEYDYDILLEF